MKTAGRVNELRSKRLRCSRVEAVQLKLHRIQVRQITSEAVQQWVSDLVELAQIAENLPPPSKIEKP